MPSLLDLGADLLSRVAGFCDLKSAGHLSLVNKQLSKAVTPVLPSLCDVSRLQLYLPFGDNGSSGELPLHEMWWGLAFAKDDYHLQLALSTEKSSGRYYLVQHEGAEREDTFLIPFDKLGQYTPQTSRLVEEFSHTISGRYRPSELSQGVINTVLQGARRAFTSKQAQYTVEKYVRQHRGQSVSVRHVAKDIQYISITFALQNWVTFHKFAPRLAAQARMRSFAAQARLRSFAQKDPLLRLFGFTPQDDVTLVGAVLCGVVRWGEPTSTGHDDCEALAEELFSYDGANN